MINYQVREEWRVCSVYVRVCQWGCSEGCRAMEPARKKIQWVRVVVREGRVLLHNHSVHRGNQTSSELEIKASLIAVQTQLLQQPQ